MENDKNLITVPMIFFSEREIFVEVMFLLVRPHLFLGALFMNSDCDENGNLTNIFDDVYFTIRTEFMTI